MNCRVHLFIVAVFCSLSVFAQKKLSAYNPVWTSQSRNASESMPCGGGDIGLNVWVENNEVFFYAGKSGSFDENNMLLKAGRVRIRLFPNPFEGGEFRQELDLEKGCVYVDGRKNGLKVRITIRVDVFHPVVDVDIQSNRKLNAEVAYENWRYRDRELLKKEFNATSYKWVAPAGLKTLEDQVDVDKNAILFYHNNQSPTVFDTTVASQKMTGVKHLLYNPLAGRISGGLLRGDNFIGAGTREGVYADTDFRCWILKSRKPAQQQSFNLILRTAQDPSLKAWKDSLRMLEIKIAKNLRERAGATENWWKSFWNRSFVHIGEPGQDIGRNYQLFRYMLACNAFGEWPTKFNGGLFTVDPVYTDSANRGTPDYRAWGGGTHTAQNQRLVYFPMFRNGDFEFLHAQLAFYTRLLKNAELRSRVYWNHDGACFTEQLENFGLPNFAEYGPKRPSSFDPGVEYNAWLEYEWDTVLEFCLMMLDLEAYTGADIGVYLPFVESCLRFFDNHYQYRAGLISRKPLTDDGKLVLYPGSAAETFKITYNANSTIAALQTVTDRMLALPSGVLSDSSRIYLEGLRKRIPDLSYTSFNGHTTIAPAKAWQRINNQESPQLYPVFPWGIFGYGKPGLDTALNTWRYDTNVVRFRSHVGWKQDNIFAARLGLTNEAWELTQKKMANSGRRFSAFWGPGFDWVPDFNWGGSGMIGVQEMLMQTSGKKIWLLPAWPKDIDVHFKLHAPYQTTVELKMEKGKIVELRVIPESRRGDVEIAEPFR